MSNPLEYGLNSAAWFLGGCVASSIYWRTVIHRQLVKDGKARKEAPLMLFVAGLVLAAAIMGLLFSEANSIRLTNYIQCQATVVQRNVEVLNRSRASMLAQTQAEIKFDEAQLAAVQDHSRHILDKFSAALRTQLATLNVRVDQLKHDPLRPVTTCTRASGPIR